MVIPLSLPSLSSLRSVQMVYYSGNIAKGLQYCAHENHKRKINMSVFTQVPETGSSTSPSLSFAVSPILFLQWCFFLFKLSLAGDLYSAPKPRFHHEPIVPFDILSSTSVSL